MLNNTTLVGRLTKDPQLFESANGSRYARFTLACSRVNGDTDFIPVTAFNVIAENLCQYKGKGDLICVTGRLKSSSWTDAAGQKHFILDAIAENIQYLDSRSKTQASQENHPIAKTEGAPARTGSSPVLEDLDEDLPF